jgi:spermidine/putrescine transport system substrate-binding protein
MRFRHLFALGSILALAATIAQAATTNLSIFIWSEYLPAEIVREFESRHGCKVTLDLFEDAETMLAKVQRGGASLYDVVVSPDYLVPAMVKLNLLAPLRPTNLVNLTNLEPRFRNPPYDPGNRYSVPYQWGTVGLYVRNKTPTPPEATWGLVFDPAQRPGPFVLIDSMRDLIGAALKYKGYSLNSTDPRQLKEARDLILATKKHCLSFDASVGARNKVLSRAAQAAIVYSGEAARGMSDDQETVYVIPREGSQIWVDNLLVPIKAPHRDLAERFIDFCLDPEIGARISNRTRFCSPNRAARPHLDAALLSNPAFYPPPETLAKLEFLEDLGARSRLYDEIWTQIKAR